MVRTTAEGPQLNPAQSEVLEGLRVPSERRRSFEPELRLELRGHLESELGPVLEGLPPDEALFVSKHQLSQVHGCEARYLAEEAEGFQWSVPLARGTVVHKAIELSMNWRGEPVPLDLVDEALARLEHDDRPVTDFLQTCSEADLAELRAMAGQYVTQFLECFPPLRKAWRPVTETPVRQELCGGRVVLVGRVDLTLGQPQGTTAGKVLIDLKTGGFSPAHVDDLRFYALIETLRLGVPPMMLATYYLDQGRLHPEGVTEGILDAAVARVVAGVERIVELRRSPEAAVKRPGPPCRWCPISADCPEGRRWLEETLDD